MLQAWLDRMPPIEPPEDPDRAVNIYACDTCGRPTVAIDIHKGTTPGCLSCHADPDLFDDDGMELVIPYVVSDEHRGMLARLADYELESYALDPIDGQLFVALAHHDPERSATVQDNLAEHLTPEQLQAFGSAVLEAASERQVRCPGAAWSTHYNLPPEEDTPWAVVELLAEPPWEWYRPSTIEELRPLENDLLFHLSQGGLLLRKRAGATGIAPSPTDLADEPATQTRWARFWKALAGPGAPAE